MSKVMIEVDAHHETLVRQFLAFAEESDHLALESPDGSVADSCEQLVSSKGTRVLASLLSNSLSRRIADSEKKTPRSAPAPAATNASTAARSLAHS